MSILISRTVVTMQIDQVTEISESDRRLFNYFQKDLTIFHARKEPYHAEWF